jgi:hypothetical protein
MLAAGLGMMAVPRLPGTPLHIAALLLLAAVGIVGNLWGVTTRKPAAPATAADVAAENAAVDAFIREREAADARARRHEEWLACQRQPGRDRLH